VPVKDDARLAAALRQAVQIGDGGIGVAVSGGSDSLALLHLCHGLGLACHAVTVDHALRAESAAEAEQVAAICAGLGVPHQTLRWDHGAIVGNLQDQARRARYALLADWARGLGLARVMIGHTADDQAETFLMGLTRAAGLDGLSGMRPAWVEAGVVFQRPLLDQTRADLRAYLTRAGVSWIDDPSNDNDRFARVRARQTLMALQPLGLSAVQITETIAHLASAQQALQAVTSAAWDVCGSEVAGAVQLRLDDFAAQPAEIQRRLLLAVIGWYSGGDYAPRAQKIATLAEAIRQGADATLHGCCFRTTSGSLRIYREPNAVKDLILPTDQIWDNRWQMIGPHAPDLTLRALGAEGLAALKDWRACGIAREALLVSPAIWRKDALIAAPIAGFLNGWQAKLVRTLNQSILSH
jgi:tRNA(Ile)-lysidine synthase